MGSIHTFSLALLLGLSLTVQAQLPQPVSTVQGLLQGTAEQDLAIFRGVPYAAAPVGANRWRAPQPLPQWAGLRMAEEFGPRCVQGNFAPGAEQPLTSEDCLYLNVWTPATEAEAELPVLVWIHGGGFFTGAGSAANYDGAALARKGAVVVTLNYRLGSFGFFTHPALSAEDPHGSSGNYALLDMLAALAWVQDNIAAFGGDPTKVALMGESAGAMAVGNLLASPLSEGLFQRAILQSGSWMGWGFSAALPQAAAREAEGLEQAATFGADSLEELRAASAADIAAHFPANGLPNVDGYLLPEDPSLLLEQGRQQNIPVLVGSNRDEGVFFGPGIQTAVELQGWAEERFGPRAAAFLEVYPANGDGVANASYLRAYSDELAWQLRQLARYQAAQGSAAWVYYFTRVPPGQEANGSTHVAELPYMFAHSAANPQWLDSDRRLSEQMTSYWINFANSGNPNGSGLQWPAFHDNSPGSVLILGETVEAETSMQPSAEALEFFDAAWQDHLQRLRATPAL